MSTKATSAASEAVSRETIRVTERRIRPYVRRTPVIEADGADFGLQRGPIRFKFGTAAAWRVI